MSHDSKLTPKPAGVLRCIECAATTTDGTGWRAMLTDGDQNAEDAEEVLVPAAVPGCTTTGESRLP